ncbi:MAG: hemin-degrading factor [Chloroflexi bacterium]|nr:hemin-degrading factor [Chloroflexota bacterium]
MGRKIRKQIYIEPEQDQMLKRQAKKLGISEAELIRRCIDQAIALTPSAPRDLEAWKEAKEFIKKRMSMSVPQTGRTWTREEIYEERLKRLSHG